MRLEGRILSTGMQGDDVRRLHDELEKLDCFVPAFERRSAVFGPATRRAVSELQRDHGSRVTGVVDQATANLITAEVGRFVG